MHYPKPFYREPRRLWYVQLDGKQVNLGRDEAEAYRRYHELMATRDHKPVAPPPTSDLVVAVLDAFLDWGQVNRARKSYDWYKRHLETFGRSIPRSLAVHQLRPFHVTAVCDAHPRWKANTRNGFCRASAAGLSLGRTTGPDRPLPDRHRGKADPGNEGRRRPARGVSEDPRPGSRAALPGAPRNGVGDGGTPPGASRHRGPAR